MSDEFEEWERSPGAQRAENVGDALTAAGCFSLVICGGPLFGFPLLFAAAAVKLVSPFTRRSGAPWDLWAPIGCGFLAAGPGLLAGLVTVGAAYWVLRTQM